MGIGRKSRFIMAVLCIVGLLSSLLIFHKKSLGRENERQDGIYTIQGELAQAAEDEISMADSAVIRPMYVIKNGENTYLKLDLQPVGTGALSGYLYEISYFPDWNNMDELPDRETTEERPVQIEDYYTQYDSYNDPDTGTDERAKGNRYPKTIRIPISEAAQEIWIKMYIPLMEAIHAGSGTQYVRLKPDWSTMSFYGELTEESAPVSVPTQTPDTKSQVSSTVSTTQVSSEEEKQEQWELSRLPEGCYTMTVEMKKTDKKTTSMANEAIGHTAIVTVENGKKTLTMEMGSLSMGSLKGYLGSVRYFKAGYMVNAKGVITGETNAAQVTAYQTDENGERIKDDFGTDYPRQVNFELVDQACEDGFAPLLLYVPVMEHITAGTGTQTSFLQLNQNSLKKVQQETARKELEVQAQSLQKSVSGSSAARDKTAKGTTKEQKSTIKKSTTKKSTKKSTATNSKSEMESEEKDSQKTEQSLGQSVTSDTEAPKKSNAGTDELAEVQKEESALLKERSIAKKRIQKRGTSARTGQKTSIVVSVLSVILGVVYKIKSRKV